MNTENVNKILSCNVVTNKHYMGCFAADKIPLCRKFPCTAVLNLDKASQRGSHWVAMYAPNSDLVYYFDSYGDAPTQLLEKYLKQYKRIIHNKRGYQALTSDVCGHYCITFIVLMSLGMKFEKVLELFDRKGKKIDIFVRDFVNEMIECSE